MSYFFFLPAYWLCGVLLYAASPRQQFRTAEQSTPSRNTAIVATGAVITLTLLILMLSQISWFVALLYTLFFAMFFIPATVFLLAHKPAWVWKSLIFVTFFSVLLQFLGAMYVA